MTNRLSRSSRSHTEDSIFLKPEEDPVWLDEPTGADRLRDLRATAAKRSVSLGPQAGGPPGCQQQQQQQQQQQHQQQQQAAERGPQEMVMQKVYGLLLEFHCWAALIVLSQVTVSAARPTHTERSERVTSRRDIYVSEHA